MKRLLSLLTGLLIFNSVLPLTAQDLIKNSSVTGVCYAGNKINKFYIPPPKIFFSKRGSKSGGSITVNYNGFSTQAKAAVDYATSILETMLPADTKITINASWEKITTSGVLAQSTITGYVGGSTINALNPLSFYPVALAEKISGETLNADLQGDITLEVNSSINWYLGTDGQTPVQKYDLVTVALHEICHGLGFFDLGEAIHDPGKYTFSILGDIGWINTRIIHKPVGDTENHLSQIILSALR